MFPSTRQNLTHMLDVAVEVGVVRQAIVDNLGKVGHTFKCKVSSSVELISCGNQALGISQVTVSAPWCHKCRQRYGRFREWDLPIPMTGVQLRKKVCVADVRHDIARCPRRMRRPSDLCVQ